MTPDRDFFPGDALVYLPDWWNPVDLIICHKTWMNCCHVAVYVGGGNIVQAVLKGVNIYPVDLRGIAGILQPQGTMRLDTAMSWFYSKAKGQGYDLLGLFNFYRRMRKTADMRRMWCSEFATRFYRAGGHQPFNPECDADMISPAQFCQTSAFNFRWRSPKMPV